jgi:GNAT superfamily N-acetyltransferase
MDRASTTETVQGTAAAEQGRKSPSPVSNEAPRALPCQVLPPQFYREAASVMAEAFSDSPAYNYIFQEDLAADNKKRDILEWMFHAYIVAICRRSPSALRGLIDDHDDDERKVIVCCFMWVESPHDHLTMWDMIVAGLWQGPFRFGLPALRRLLATLDAFQADAHHFGTTNYVMLERMAVRADRRGQGIGSACLRQVMMIQQQANDNDDAAPEGNVKRRDIILHTQLDANVRFYQKLGFHVVHDAIYFADDEKYRYHQRAMKHAATGINNNKA